MPLYLLAQVRGTETWGLDHVLGLLIVAGVVVGLVTWVRVIRRR